MAFMVLYKGPLDLGCGKENSFKVHLTLKASRSASSMLGLDAGYWP